MAATLPKFAVLSAALLFASAASASLDYRLTAQGVVVQGLAAERVTLESTREAAVRIEGISYPGVGGLGSIELLCKSTALRCVRGRLLWSPLEEAGVEMDFSRDARSLRLSTEGASIEIVVDPEGVALAVDSLPLDWVRRLEPLRGRIAELSGEFSATISGSKTGWLGAALVSGANFDTPDGWAAGAALDGGVDIEIDHRGAISVEALWSSGEMLFGPLYLPSPAPQIRAGARIEPMDEGWQITRLNARAGDRLQVAGSGTLIQSVDGWTLPEISVSEARAELDWAWRQGLRSLAAAAGWGALEPTGRVTVSVDRSSGRDRSIRVDVHDANLADGDDRVSIDHLFAGAQWGDETPGLEISAEWSEASLYRVPLGPSRLALGSTGRDALILEEPARIPILDGALIVEELVWHLGSSSQRDLAMAARLEPVDLAELSQRFGWPSMGGRIAGRFPGLRFASETVSFDGGLDLQLFDGTARIESLSIERPFGNDPALSADVRFDALDLDLLTRAFEIGRMQGLLSGSIGELRLLSWQPVSFDAWFETLTESPQREISQRAVDSLSSLSGGGGAAVSGILMRWFESFPYRKLGLGCRLSANVCSMRGLRETGEGGYLILEGRAIPRLDIVGYQRRVDWPRLVGQLRAAVESSGP